MGYAVVTHPDLELSGELVAALARAGQDGIAVPPAELDAFLDGGRTDVLVCGADEGHDAVRLWEHARSRAPHVPCVIVTPDRSASPARRALRARVRDYLSGPLAHEDIATAIVRVVEDDRLTRVLRDAARAGGAHTSGGDAITGRHRSIRAVRAVVSRIADNDASVLVLGETGTGKELVARSIHSQSSRRRAPFVAVNCAALPAALVESELFGHAKGSFTGAARERQGLFEAAEGGTILLDEIGELPSEAQAKLLRVLQDRAVRKVGGREERSVDVRVIAATSTDLAVAVRKGRFREDLLYRLDVVRIVVPPLRERGDDVLLLAQRFVEQHAAREGKHVVSLTRGAGARLLRYGWPGNVRELSACIHRAVVFARHRYVTERDLPERIGPKFRDRTARYKTEERVPLSVVECAHLARVMRDVAGNKSLAAQILGLDRKTLYRKLRVHGLLDVAEPDELCDTQTVVVPRDLID